MGFVTVKDFATALGVNGVTVRQRIVRGKLVKNEYGLIDVTEPINYSYVIEINAGDLSVFDDYYKSVDSLAKVSKKTIAPTKKIEKISVDNKTVKKEVVLVDNPKKIDEKKVDKILSNEEKKIIVEQKKINALLLSFDIRKKEAEVKLKEREAELKQYELEKKAGNTLPLDMIEKVVGINYKAVLKSCHSQSKNIAMVMVQQLGGSKEDLNGIMIELDNIFDNVVKDSQKKAKVDIQKMIDEYSEIRSRGEKR